MRAAKMSRAAQAAAIIRIASARVCDPLLDAVENKLTKIREKKRIHVLHFKRRKRSVHENNNNYITSINNIFVEYESIANLCAHWSSLPFRNRTFVYVTHTILILLLKIYHNRYIVYCKIYYYFVPLEKKYYFRFRIMTTRIRDTRLEYITIFRMTNIHLKT